MTNTEVPNPIGRRPVLAGLMEFIIDSPVMLVVLQTPRPEAVLDHLRQTPLREGQAAYQFIPGLGISSLRQPGVHVPGTRGAFNALRHIDASTHYWHLRVSPRLDT